MSFAQLQRKEISIEEREFQQLIIYRLHVKLATFQSPIGHFQTKLGISKQAYFFWNQTEHLSNENSLVNVNLKALRKDWNNFCSRKI